MSNTSNTTVRSSGVSFLGLLAVLFIGLKLTGVIAWSWLWALAPLWIPTAVVLVILVVLLIFIGLAKLLDR